MTLQHAAGWGEQQGKCSHKHRLFILSFCPGSHRLAQLFSVFQLSPQRQNHDILKETATEIQQLKPGAKAPFPHKGKEANTFSHL